jgi:AraC-like DNA-binding protein
MDIITVPDDVKKQPQLTAGQVTFVNYREKGSLFKNRVVFNCYAISFVLNGQKEIYRAAGNTILRAGQAMLIPEGNSIIAEHSLNNNQYNSVLLFFPGHLAAELLAKHTQPAAKFDEDVPPYIHFAGTPYLQEYVKGICALIDGQHTITDKVARHKLEELLLVISELYPTQLANLFHQHNNNQSSLKNLVEQNLFNRLTIEELAFLANRSVSSFKRDFEKTYHIAPQKYIRERKLEAASMQLAKGAQASELYDVYGYDNLSNFTTAFKKKFGLTPAAYRHTATI